LVIDDDPDIRAFLQDVLELEGCTVATAPDAQRGLAQAQAQPPDLILLDYQMPILDGPGFAQAYRQLPLAPAPIVLMTAAARAQERCAEVQAEGCLPKPFDLDALLAEVGRFVAPAA
jgi:CheY-like chemotaxis protein